MAINGTYRPSTRRAAHPDNRGRVLAAVGTALLLLGVAGSYLTNAQMVAIEDSGGQRLSEVGSVLTRLLPSILTSLSKSNAAFNSPGRASGGSLRGSVTYVDAKRALERWVATAGLGLALLLFGLEDLNGPAPASATDGGPARASIGADMARLVLMAAIVWGAFSIFETG